jgi:hypothetical protein
MEEDPVGLASDVLSLTGNVAKLGGLSMAPKKIATRTIQNLKGTPQRNT